MKQFYRLEFAVSLGVSLVILILCRYIGVTVALLFVALREGASWYGSDRLLKTLRSTSARAIAEFSAVLLIGQSIRAPQQILLALGLGLWLIWLELAPKGTTAALITAGVSQAGITMALFLTSSLPGWHWSNWLVLGFLWPASWLIAWRLLDTLDERLAPVLSAAWALAAVEISWVLLLWQVSYGLPGGFILIPQATVILLSLGYCFLSIYLAHRRAQLSRARLAEYAIIGLGLLLLVLAGTRWNGSV